MSYLSEAAHIFKHTYAEDMLGPTIERDHTLLSMLTKKKGGSGADYSYLIPFSNPQAVGGTFSTIQTAAAASGKSKGVQATTQPVLKYGDLQIDGPSLQRAGDRKGAFFDLVTGETDGILEEMGNRLGFDLYRSGNGMRARRSSASTNVITLTVADDVRNFSPNMTVIADDTITGASPRSGSTTVTAVDEDGGTITLASAAAITSFADNDYLFAAGDPGTCMDGLELFFPLTAPTYGSDSFRGHDRGQDVRRLAGSRVDDTSSYWEEAIGLAAVKVQNNKFKPECAFTNPLNVWAMSKRMNAKIEYQAGKTAEIFFQYITINTPGGAVKVYADPDCPTTRAFVGNMDFIHALYLGSEFIHTIKDDGREMVRLGTSDGIESRFRVHSQTIVPRPGSWAIVRAS